MLVDISAARYTKKRVDRIVCAAAAWNIGLNIVLVIGVIVLPTFPRVFPTGPVDVEMGLSGLMISVGSRGGTLRDFHCGRLAPTRITTTYLLAGHRSVGGGLPHTGPISAFTAVGWPIQWTEIWSKDLLLSPDLVVGRRVQEVAKLTRATGTREFKVATIGAVLLPAYSLVVGLAVLGCHTVIVTVRRSALLGWRTPS